MIVLRFSMQLMTSVMCLCLSVQEENIVEDTNDKCNL
jgi:hypothetical protein